NIFPAASLIASPCVAAVLTMPAMPSPACCAEAEVLSSRPPHTMAALAVISRYWRGERAYSSRLASKDRCARQRLWPTRSLSVAMRMSCSFVVEIELPNQMHRLAKAFYRVGDLHQQCSAEHV